MKRIILLFFVCILSITTKSQGGFPNADSVINFLNGGWNWYISCGGFPGGCTTPATEGYKALRFQKINNVSDSIYYKVYFNYTMYSQGKTHFKLVSDPTFGNYWELSFISGMGGQLGITKSKTGDTLTLFEPCLDCHNHSYRSDEEVSIKENNFQPDMRVYPNPVAEFLNINSSEIIESAIAYDISGKAINLFISGNRIDVIVLKPGVYGLKLGYADKTYFVRFIKE